MNQNQIITEVKQGNSKAISILINHILKAKEIKITKIMVKEDYWQLMLEGEEIPDQIEVVSLLEKGLIELKIDTIKKVKIYGKKKTEVNPNWQSELLLPAITKIQDQSHNFEAQLVKVEIVDNSQLQLGLRQRAKEGDLSAIAELLNTALGRKNVQAKVVLQNNCLQILLESYVIPNQEDCIRIIKREMLLLKIINLEKIHIYGKKIGDEIPIWDQEIDLTPKLINIKSIPSKSFNLPIITLSSITIFGLLLLVGSSLGLRFHQQQKITEANKLLNQVKQEEISFDKASFETNKKVLESALIILEETPKFPLPLTLSGEINEKLNSTKEQIKETDQTIVTIENIQAKVKAVADTFYAIDSSLDVGMNYRDYTEKVRELKVQIDSLTRDTEAIKHPVYTLLLQAFEHYNFAKDVWQYYLESDNTHSFFPRFSSYGSKLVSEYDAETIDIVGTEYIYLDTSLAQIWMKANSVLEEVKKQI